MWSDVNIIAQQREDCASVITVVTDSQLFTCTSSHMISAISLASCQEHWCLSNVQSAVCECGWEQIINCIVGTCPLSTFEGSFQNWMKFPAVPHSPPSYDLLLLAIIITVVWRIAVTPGCHVVTERWGHRVVWSPAETPCWEGHTRQTVR